MLTSCTRARVAACATLAALGLAPVAHAQTLTLGSGDAATVSAAGTVGTIGGTPVANGTTSYTTSNLYAVQTNGTSAFTLGAGGSLNSSNYGLYALGTSTVTVSGGTLSGGTYGLFANGTSTATVIGGVISAGTNGYGLFASSGGTINLFSLGGTPFLVNNVSMNNKTLTSGTSGTISGTLLDGETLNTKFYDLATINLNVGTPPAAAPEPSQFAAFAVGLLGLGALAVKARRAC